jgi:4'-phosphopantetheinyl transferase
MSGGTHLWTIHLVATMGQVRDFYRSLSPEEQQRAAAFRFERDKTFFVIGRGLLRSLLGWYVSCAPEHIRFKYGTKGKPALAYSKSKVHFNLAYSAGRVLYAVSEDCELGVDLELVRPLSDIASIAKHFFSPTEYQDLFSVPGDKRTEAFFNCWTRKEAYVKATGYGLSVPLNRSEVSLSPREPTGFLKIEGETVSKWGLFHLEPAAGYVGALAKRSVRGALSMQGFDTAEELLAYLKMNPAAHST